MAKGRRAVFLDRDGTLIEEKGYLKDPAQVVLERGAAEAVARFNREGFAVVLVTNQSGVARGYFTEEDVAAVHRKIELLLADGRARLDGVYYCPHYPDGEVAGYRRVCSCRKPAGGLLLQAAEELGIDLRASYVIGDKLTDAELARREGLAGVLVRTGYGEREWKACLQDRDSVKPDRSVADLSEAADFVVWAESRLAHTEDDPGGDRDERRTPLWSTKWVSDDLLDRCLEAHRSRGRTVVLARGVFDLLHTGHVGYLQAAKDLGDVLVVALNDDRSARDLKGPDRPILPVEERVEIVSALGCVDYCVVFWDRAADRVIERVRPDFLAEGTGCEEESVPEREAVTRYGGRARAVGPAMGRATATLIDRIRGQGCRRS